MKIGTYAIPDVYRLPALIQDLKTMYNKFESRDVDFDTLASIMGHKSAKSGAFTQKITNMKAYHLIDGRGKVQVTETGRKIALPNNIDELNEGLIEALTSIPLWREIYDKFTKIDKQLPTSDFWVEIRQICGITPDEAQNKAEIVKKTYLEDIKDIKVPKQGEKPDMNETKTEVKTEVQSAGVTIPISSTVITEVISLEGGTLKLILPKDNIQETWKRAKKMVDAYFGVDN